MSETSSPAIRIPFLDSSRSVPRPITPRPGFPLSRRASSIGLVGIVVTAAANAPLFRTRAANAWAAPASGTTAKKEAPLPDITTGVPPPSCRSVFSVDSSGRCVSTTSSKRLKAQTGGHPSGPPAVKVGSVTRPCQPVNFELASRYAHAVEIAIPGFARTIQWGGQGASGDTSSPRPRATAKLWPRKNGTSLPSWLANCRSLSRDQSSS